jgi:hypothetical protein
MKEWFEEENETTVVNGKLMPKEWERDKEEDLYPYPRTLDNFVEARKRTGILISEEEFNRWQWLEKISVQLWRQLKEKENN